MRQSNVIFVTNRSFTSYCGIDAIENDFRVPMFGSRNMLRMEERTEESPGRTKMQRYFIRHSSMHN